MLPIVILIKAFFCFSISDNIIVIALQVDTISSDQLILKLQPRLSTWRDDPITEVEYTRNVKVQQGLIKGLVKKMTAFIELNDVDQFLGIPYAEAPIESKRFMPPGSPSQWRGVKVASHLPAVCPQTLPNLKELKHQISKGRFQQMAKLFPYLKNESEDCLYLNIYAPHWDGVKTQPKYPVVVYVHGESFEWNSGNPYDGSILASFGRIIVITMNYRLGILGFLKYEKEGTGNFGLLDQVAALQWIKDNIEAFGGDKKRVTLMGHGTGAILVNLLMISPISKDLFNSSILMSGSATSDWTMKQNSLEQTLSIAASLNCTPNEDTQNILSCLKQKRYQELTKIRLTKSETDIYASFGPTMDGLIIPNDPQSLMTEFSDIFGRYNLLFGMTEIESCNLLKSSALIRGINEVERDDLLTLYLQRKFFIRPDLALSATLKRYEDSIYTSSNISSYEHRNIVLDILSDALVVGPLLQTGLIHSKLNPNCFMYVLYHKTEFGFFPNINKSATGEELSFVFGDPIASTGIFYNKYSFLDIMFSKTVMTYWANFIKSGDPTPQMNQDFSNLGTKDWEGYNIEWPKFNARIRAYMKLEIRPTVDYEYRKSFTNFWNKDLPYELSQISEIELSSNFSTKLSKKILKQEVESSNTINNKFLDENSVKINFSSPVKRLLFNTIIRSYRHNLYKTFVENSNEVKQNIISNNEAKYIAYFFNIQIVLIIFFNVIAISIHCTKTCYWSTIFSKFFKEQCNENYTCQKFQTKSQNKQRLIFTKKQKLNNKDYFQSVPLKDLKKESETDFDNEFRLNTQIQIGTCKGSFSKSDELSSSFREPIPIHPFGADIISNKKLITTSPVKSAAYQSDEDEPVLNVTKLTFGHLDVQKR